MKKIVYFLAFLFCASAPSYGETSVQVDISVQKQQETIRLSVPYIAPRKIFTISNPDRLVVDIPSVPGKHSVALPRGYKGKYFKAARFGQFDPDTSRFVFDLAKPVQVQDVREEGSKKHPVLAVIVTLPQEQTTAAHEDSEPEAAPANTKRSLNPTKSNRVEEQKTGGKPLIIIDPGHGGVDPGTIGPDGTQEKDVVLEYGKALRDRLIKTGQYRVKMTRDDDRFIPLRGRVEIAKKAKASLFISIHADSAPAIEARGLSLYTLSEKASDKEAEMLAAQENKADVLAGMDLSDERQDVADILISLAQRETNNRSATLGDRLVMSLDGKIKLLPNPHRFAGFAVLKAPDIPSVLIETGFLSHPGEAKLLKSRAYRDKVIGGVVAGVDGYFRQKKKAEGE